MYVHIILDSFLCWNWRKARSSVVWTPIRHMTLHVIDYRGAASLCYRISRRITVFMCEQKPYPLFCPHDRICALQTKSGQKGMWIVSHELHVSILTSRRLQRWSVNGTLQCTSLQASADSCQHYTLCYLQAVMNSVLLSALEHVAEKSVTWYVSQASKI